MKTLEQMCAVLNRLLDIDEAAANALLGAKAACSPASWPQLVADSEITVLVDKAGMAITPLLLINSLVSEQRADGEYSIFRDVSATGGTVNFFVAKVDRSYSDIPRPEAGGAT